MNVIARLEYELAYNDFAGDRFNHYTTRTPSFRFGYCSFSKLSLGYNSVSLPKVFVTKALQNMDFPYNKIQTDL